MKLVSPSWRKRQVSWITTQISNDASLFGFWYSTFPLFDFYSCFTIPFRSMYSYSSGFTMKIIAHIVIFLSLISSLSPSFAFFRQFGDTPTYVKTIHHLSLHPPVTILVPAGSVSSVDLLNFYDAGSGARSSAASSNSVLVSCLEDTFDLKVTPLKRIHWNDSEGKTDESFDFILSQWSHSDLLFHLLTLHLVQELLTSTDFSSMTSKIVGFKATLLPVQRSTQKLLLVMQFLLLLAPNSTLWALFVLSSSEFLSRS